jgi:predicted PurR-regulated permease PerM
MQRPLASASSRSLIETVLILLVLLALLVAMYEVLRVFFGVFTFALIFSVSFAPLFERFCKLLKGRRKLAAFIYSIVLIAVIALPFIFIISTMTHHMRDAVDWVTDVKQNGVPPLPEWLAKLPMVGEGVSAFWQQFQENPKELVVQHEHQIRGVLRHVMTGGAGMLGATFQFIAGIIISAVLLAGGVKILQPVRLMLKHMLGEGDADALMAAAAQAVKGVSVGVMGTAFIAAVISWIGLAIASVPFSAGLAALVFFLVLIQVGPLVVWIPLVIWAFVQGHTGWAVFFAIYGIFVMIVDSVMKPILIAKSGKLPFLVLFLGVIGGMVAWGFTGMFKGAIILALFYTIFNTWLERRNSVEEAEMPPLLDPAI